MNRDEINKQIRELKSQLSALDKTEKDELKSLVLSFIENRPFNLYWTDLTEYPKFISKLSKEDKALVDRWADQMIFVPVDADRGFRIRLSDDTSYIHIYCHPSNISQLEPMLGIQVNMALAANNWYDLWKQQLKEASRIQFLQELLESIPKFED